MRTQAHPLLPGSLPNRRRLRDEAHALILLCAMGALMGYCGWIVSGEAGIAWSILLGLGFLALVRHVNPDGVLRAIKARPVRGPQANALEQRIAALCERAGLHPAPRLFHWANDVPLALSVSDGDTSAIVVTDRVLRDLDLGELTAVLAHELIHLRNGDIVLMQWGLVLGWVTRIVSEVGCVLLLIGLAARALSLVQFPLVALTFLVFAPLISTSLRLALSRDREAEADAEAAALTGDPDALISALLKIRDGQPGRVKRLLPRPESFRLSTLLADHPPTEQRIRALRQLRRKQADR
jgi:heat shock protein HtpX